MKRYICPQMTTAEIKADSAMLSLSSIDVTQEENNSGYDVKESDCSEEDLYKIFLGWDF